MTIEKSCPDRATWQRWLHAESAVSTESPDLIRHLDDCEDCQRYVTSLTDQDGFYRRSATALRALDVAGALWQSDEDQDCVDVPAREANPALVTLVQSLLGPTDDEHSLGRLGRFEVLGIVGSGGMGIVLKARSMAVDRIVAIKIPQPQYWQAPETLAVLEREARSAASVVHPNVIAIYHVDRYRDVPYMVMPFHPGQSLQQRIHQRGPLPIDEVLHIVRQVAAALAAAHACGVVHRDVKPANILLGKGTDRVVLTDFGLAKVQTDATCTATGTFAGTPIYLSPEIASGEHAGPAGDIYSLGTVLWTMLIGHPPMASMHTHAIVRQIAESGVTPMPQPPAETRSPWVDRLLARLHAREPEDRPTADTVARWAESCQKHLGDPRCPLPTELMASRRPAKRLAAIVVLSLALTLLIAVIALVKPNGGEPEGTSQTPIDATNAGGGKSPPAQSVSPLSVQETAFLNRLRDELETVNSEQIPDLQRRIDTLIERVPSLQNSSQGISP